MASLGAVGQFSRVAEPANTVHPVALDSLGRHYLGVVGKGLTDGAPQSVPPQVQRRPLQLLSDSLFSSEA